MLRFDRTTAAQAPAPPERCLALLADVERYPEWTSLIRAVEVERRTPEGAPQLLQVRAHALGLPIELRCALELAADGAVLRRIANDSADEERFETAWTVAAAADGATASAVELRVSAALDVPGPAGFLGGRLAPRLVDELMAEFLRAV